jgi:hypothetical protein
MKRLTLVVLLLGFPVVFAEDLPSPAPVSTQALAEGNDKFNHRASHWVGQFAFESLQYETPHSFSGQNREISDTTPELLGIRVGIGREAYLGGGFLMGARLDGYYFGLIQTDERASRKLTEEQSAMENTGQLFGGDAIGHLGWMFDYRTKNPFLGEMTYMSMELFVEAGLGVGRGYHRKDYFYEVGTRDDYDRIIEDSFNTQILSIGANFLSTTTGYFFTLRGSRYTHDITKRTIRESSQVFGGGVVTKDQVTLEDVAMDPIMVFSLGGGYKF